MDNFIFSNRMQTDVYKNAEEGLARVKLWLDLNKLSLNVNKTKYITLSWYKSVQPTNKSLKLNRNNCGVRGCDCCCIENKVPQVFRS